MKKKKEPDSLYREILLEPEQVRRLKVIVDQQRRLDQLLNDHFKADPREEKRQLVDRLTEAFHRQSQTMGEALAASSTLSTRLMVEAANQRRLMNSSLKEHFENEPDRQLRDFVRLVTFINRLQGKILDWEAGLRPVNPQEYQSLDQMLSQSEQWLEALQNQENPLKGKFSEIDGLVIDHAFFKDNGRYHLIYIRSEAATSWQEVPSNTFGYATSEDLVDWKMHQPVLSVVEDSWENTNLWAPHVIRHDGKFWMFYTGVNENAAQAISAAVSTDLLHWERVSKEPLVKPGPWGHWDPANFSNARDPFVLEEDDSFYIYYTAYSDEDHHYRIGIAYSRDLLNWEDRGNVKLENSLTTPPESPFVIKRDGRYYLFYTSYTDGIVAAVSNKPDSGFVDLKGRPFVLLPKASAAEFLQDDDGRWYMTVITHQPNHFHFLEVFEMEWPENENEGFTLTPVVR